MKKIIILLFITLPLNIIFSQNALDTLDYSNDVKKKIEIMNLVQTGLKTNYSYSKLKQRKDFSVDFSLKSPENDCEVYYSLYPWYVFSNFNNTTNQKQNLITFASFSNLLMMNIVGEDKLNEYQINLEALNDGLIKQYNIDKGILVKFITNGKLFKPYNYVIMMELYKENRGVIVITILAKNAELFSKIPRECFLQYTF